MDSREQKKLSANCRKIFDDYDTNHDGTIDLSQIEEMLYLMGQNPTLPEIKDILSRSENECPDGRIEFDLFLDFVKSVYKSTESNALDLRRSFQMLDPKQTGCVQEEKLRHLLTQFGDCMTPAQIDEMLSLVNKNGSKTVNYEDFVFLFTKSVQELEGEAKGIDGQ